jgi:hypothetical protein
MRSGIFQRNPSLRTGEISLRLVKSLGGEIPLRGVRDGFHFTECGAQDFIQDSIRSPRKQRRRFRFFLPS